MMNSKSSARARDRDKKHATVSWETVRQFALELPGAVDATSYGMPAIKIGKKLMLRLRDDREAFAMASDFEERQLLMDEQPEIFYITDHYLNYPWVLVQFSTVRADQVPDLLRQAWRKVAPRKLVAEFDAFGGDN